jgi:hypothetical protein
MRRFARPEWTTGDKLSICPNSLSGLKTLNAAATEAFLFFGGKKTDQKESKGKIRMHSYCMVTF